MAISFIYREQKEQLQKMKDFGSEPQMADHLPPQDSRLQNSRPGMYPVWEKCVLRK
jgi:YLP motif-containing protein 1